LRKELLSGLIRRAVAQALDEPVPAVPLMEFGERLPQLFHGSDRAHPQQLLFQRADESVDAPFPSGCRTNAGDDSIPRVRISA